MSAARVVIVGGGISGLAAAYYLSQSGIDSLLIEKSNRLGGLIRTDFWQGSTLEAGPDSYLAAKPAVTELAAALGSLTGQIIASNDKQRRVFIVRNEKLVPLPKGMSMMVPGNWQTALSSSLFSFKTKARFVRELASRPRRRENDISVGELVADHFGPEVLQYVADPLLAGVYGGEAAQLSAASVLPRFIEYEQQFGSLIRGVRRASTAQPASGLFRSFRDGMQSLTDALSAAVSARAKVLQTEVIAVTRGANSWNLRTADETLSADAVILACPAHVSARLLAKTAPTLSDRLADIPYSSALLVTLVYRENDVPSPLEGVGLLVPTPERRTVAAATWINSKFPTRVAPRHIAVRAFIVGSQAIQLAHAPDAELTALAIADLGRFIGFAGAPQFSKIDRWPNSMPQYVVGHRQRQQNIAAELETLPDLHLIGNAFDGVGIPDCIRLAKSVAAHLSRD